MNAGPLPAAELSLGVTLAVLGAAFLHALWNAMLKAAAGVPMLDTALIVAGTSVVCVVLMPFVPPPAAAAWPFIAAVDYSVPYLNGMTCFLDAAYWRGVEAGVFERS